MSILSKLDKFAIIKKALRMDREADEMLEDHVERRKDFDKRLERVTRATLNGETEWFLRLVEKDPDCVLEIVKECDLKK